MVWLSPTEVVKEFNLHPNGDSSEEILRCVRRELAAIHPDKSNSNFANPSDKERWHKLTAAKEYLESLAQGQMAMIPVNQLPSLIRYMREATTESISVRIEQILSESRGIIRHATLFPKLTSGVFAAICAFLINASSSLKDHPLLGAFIKNPIVQIFLLFTMFFAGILFFMFWFDENRTDRYLEWLLTEDGTQRLLSRVLNDAQPTDTGLSFTFKQLIKTIHKSQRIRLLIPIPIFIPIQYISHPLVEKIAKLMIDRLKEEQIVTELPKRGLSPSYEVPNGLIQEIYEKTETSPLRYSKWPPHSPFKR